MDSTERQIAPTRAGIRRDHVARYEFVAKKLTGNPTVIDACCGVGYGTQLLAEAGCNTVGIEKDAEAVAYAKEHYSHDLAQYICGDLTQQIELPSVDVAVCFEAVEHIKDPRPMLQSLHNSAQLLIASVPNEEVFPWVNYAHHFRHYTKAEFEELLNECGWNVIEWHGQHGRATDVEPDIKGRTLIAVAERISEINQKGPEHVTILGLGQSLEQYVNITKRLGGRRAYCDETWGINALGDVIKCDLIFHMDDVRIQEIRAKAKPESNIARMIDWMRVTNVPIITSRAHPDYQMLVEFPLEQAMNELKHDYFNSTTAYAIAFAIMLGVERISLFGCDYTYPNAHDAEKGRACVEFWLGIATERGIKITLPKQTSLMDALHTSQERLYGYDTQDVSFIEEGDRLKVTFTERTELPTAEEIEAAYDHSAHPNILVSGEESETQDI